MMLVTILALLILWLVLVILDSIETANVWATRARLNLKDVLCVAVIVWLVAGAVLPRLVS